MCINNYKKFFRVWSELKACILLLLLPCSFGTISHFLLSDFNQVLASSIRIHTRISIQWSKNEKKGEKSIDTINIWVSSAGSGCMKILWNKRTFEITFSLSCTFKFFSLHCICDMSITATYIYIPSLIAVVVSISAFAHHIRKQFSET